VFLTAHKNEARGEKHKCKKKKKYRPVEACGWRGQEIKTEIQARK
jgi:hypothetical protein